MYQRLRRSSQRQFGRNKKKKERGMKQKSSAALKLRTETLKFIQIGYGLHLIC